MNVVLFLQLSMSVPAHWGTRDCTPDGRRRRSDGVCHWESYTQDLPPSMCVLCSAPPAILLLAREI